MNMDARQETLLDEVRNLVAEKLRLEAHAITYSSSFVEDLGVDSLDMVEIVMEFEAHYNIAISERDISHITTLGDVVQFIQRRLEAKS